MQNWLKFENASAIIASLTAASLCIAIIFLLGYSSESSYVILSYASYHDILIIAAQAFLTNLGAGAAGIIVQFVSEEPKQAAPIFGQTTSEKRPVVFKIFDQISGQRFPAKTVLFLSYFFAYVGADLMPKRYLGDYCFALLILGAVSYFIFAIRSSNYENRWLNSKSVLAAAIFVCMATYYFGNYSFYYDLFFNPTSVTLSGDLNNKRHFALVRKITDSLVLFDQETGRLIVADKNLGTFFVLDSPICNESRVQRRLRLATSNQNCN